MKPRSNQGFTLIEVMVACIIFVIFCIVFLNSAVMSMKSQQLAGDYYRAITVARNRIQRARTFEYSSLLLMSEVDVPVDGNGNISPSGHYKRTTLVSIYTNGTPNLIKVTVQVNYPSARGTMSDQPVELSTLITDKM